MRTKVRVLFIISSLAFLASSFSVILMLLTTAPFVTGIVFWSGMILGIIFYIIAYRAMPRKAKGTTGREIPAALRFFSSKLTIITDALIAICLALTIYFAINYQSNQTVAAIILFLFIASVYAHFLFNGKVYRYCFKKANIRERRRSDL